MGGHEAVRQGLYDDELNAEGKGGMNGKGARCAQRTYGGAKLEGG